MKPRVLALAIAALVSSTIATVQAAPPPSSVTVVNTTANPVPVAAASPLPITPPLWQGTPSLSSHIVINHNSDGFEQCESFFTAAAGQALLLKTVTGSFNVPPGGFGGVRLLVTVVGGSDTVFLDVPMHPTAPAAQIAGLFDQYTGSLDGGGIPIIAAEECLEGIQAAGSLELIGFVVTVPN